MLKKLINAVRNRNIEPDTFTTRYHGECAACGKPIHPGDTVGRVYMARRRIGNGIADDPYRRVCCRSCCVDAARHGDPSLRWES